MRRTLLAWCGAAWLAVAAVGAQQPAPPAVSPDYVIGPQDVLQISFWRDNDLSTDVVVRPDGKITMPLLNEFEAAGLTPEQLRLVIVEAARRYFEEPRVVVTVKQINSRFVFIMGEIAKPGSYPLIVPTSVLQLIATAGGLSEFAASDDIVVHRTLGGQQVRYRFNYKSVMKGKDLKQNIELKSGDTIIVP